MGVPSHVMVFHGLVLWTRITIIHFNDVYEMAGVLQDRSQAWLDEITDIATHGTIAGSRIRESDKDLPKMILM